MAKIQQAVQRMTSLIDNLLNLSQVIRDEKLVKNIDLNVVLSEVKNDLEVAILEKGAIVTNDELLSLEAVPEQMRQLLSNLLANALKYSHPDRVPEVYISATLLPLDAEIALPGFESDKKYFELKVEDNGIGFDPKFAEKIFIVFQRLHSQNQYSGTVVGLALCKKVVHNHGGEIYADSVPGQGSIFRAILPVRQQDR